MPKNKGKGGKNRRKGANGNDEDKRELLFKEDGTEYAQITKVIGGGYFDGACFDGVKRQCHVRGKLRKKVWINLGDIVLVSLRDFEEGKADIFHKYSVDEAKSLKAYGELPDVTKINETDANAEEGQSAAFEFEDIDAI